MSYDNLKLENQLCFPLYAASRKVIQQYTPLLEKIGLTYTQYIAMMVLWHNAPMTVNELSRQLHLDSGTVTPLLQKMQTQGLVQRNRSNHDERSVVISLTPKGTQLEELAHDIPLQLAQCIQLSPEDATTLYKLLYQILDK